jgi:hypothetical protein
MKRGREKTGGGQGRPVAVAVFCSALLLLVPVHAAGPPDAAELGAAPGVEATPKGIGEAEPDGFPMEEFLDRLMVAESGGHLNRKNPRSTALGPFQFIESTFLFVAGKHFPTEIAGSSERKVLALRTNMAFSRRAARAYAGDLISALRDQGLSATTVNVRLAFLVGPQAAVRLLRAPPDQALKGVLSADAIAANPFMSGATVAHLLRRAAAEVGATPPETVAGVAAAEPLDAAEAGPTATLVALQSPIGSSTVSNGEPPGGVAVQRGPATAPSADSLEPTGSTGPRPFEVKCDIGLASCRRWIALQERKALAVSSGER